MRKNINSALDAECSDILAEVDKLESRVRTLVEFGLFGTSQEADVVLKPLTAARELARGGDVDGSAESLDRAEIELHAALHKRSRIWRALNVHQTGLFLYHVIAILFLLNIATGYFSFVSKTLWPDLSVPLSAVVAGALGASLRGLWFLWLQVSKGIFRSQFTLVHLVSPWVGALFGLFAYLLIKASFIAVTGGEADKPEASALPLALEFLAGYSWEWISDRINQVRNAAGTATPKPTPDTKPPKPAAESSKDKSQERSSIENKIEIFAFLNANPAFYMATVEGGKPHVRGMYLYRADEQGIIFHTGKMKDLHRQLTENNQVEMCFTNGNMESLLQIRVSGRAELVEDMDLKREIVENRAFLKPFVEQAGYDSLAVYRMKSGVATVWTMETNFAPKRYIPL